MKKIRYLFPKAHAAAYLIMELKLAWYKQHFPLAFYKELLTESNSYDALTPNDFLKNDEEVTAEIERLTDKENPMRQYGYEGNRVKALKLIADARKHGIYFDND